MKKKDIEHAIKIAMLRGAIRVDGFDIISAILREARENSKRKNTILFALLAPKFREPETHILVRLNSGNRKKSRVVRVSQRAVSIGLNRHSVPQISVLADVIGKGNKITGRVSLGYGTEVINFISASK